MKKILLIIVATTMAMTAYAQNDPHDKRPIKTTVYKPAGNASVHNQDGFLKKNGRMMEVRNGKTKKMRKNMTLPNGMVIMKDGSYFTKPGSSNILNDGYYISRNGELMRWNYK